jgi:ABC-type transport system involved in multi-copper enzyme maturation permease subunit
MVMLKTIVIKQTIRENILQPAFLLTLIIQIAVIGILAFGVGLHYENGLLVSFDWFGGKIEEQVHSFAETFASANYELVSSSLMFLFIIGCSFLYPELLRSPLLIVTLARPVSRASLFLSKFAGFSLLVFSAVIIFSLIVSAIFYEKSDGNIGGSLLLGSVSFCFEFITIFAICSLVGLLIENSMGTAVIAVALYFFLGPLVADAGEIQNPLLKVSLILLPPVGQLSRATQELVLSYRLNPDIYLLSLLYIAVILGVSTTLFHRRDIG